MRREIAKRIISLMAQEGYISSPDEVSARHLAYDIIEPGCTYRRGPQDIEHKDKKTSLGI